MPEGIVQEAGQEVKDPDIRFAVQEAVVPPPDPVQLQFHGPDPATAVAVPVEQKLAVGIEDVFAAADPQAPFTVAAHLLPSHADPEAQVAVPVLLSNVRPLENVPSLR